MRRRNMMQSQSGELPSRYVRVKYLESSGDQYIITPFLVELNDKILVSASSLSEKNFNTIIGTNIKSTAELYFYSHKIYTWNSYIHFDIISTDGNEGYGNVRNIKCEVTLCDKSESSYEIGSYTRSYTLKGRIYSVEVFGKFNLIPALDPSGRPCMYCIVTKQPFYNSGTGEFGYELMDGTYIAPI